MRVAAVNLERGGKVKKKIDPAAEKPKLVCGNEKMASIGYQLARSLSCTAGLGNCFGSFCFSGRENEASFRDDSAQHRCLRLAALGYQHSLELPKWTGLEYS